MPPDACRREWIAYADADLRLGPLHRGFDRAPGEHAAEVRLVLDRALQVGLHVDTLGGLGRRGLDGRRIQTLADEPGLHTLGAHRHGAGTGDADAGLRAGAV